MSRALAVVILGGVMMFFGCSDPSYTTQQLMSRDAESAKQAVDIELARAEIEKNVSLFSDVFSRYKRDELARAIPRLYAEQAFLNDRIHSVEGRENIAAYFDGTFDKIHQGEFLLQDEVYGKQDVFLRWVMRIQRTEGDSWMEFTGISQLRFDSNAQIIYHQDYWDFSELMGEITGIRSIVNYVKQKA